MCVCIRSYFHMLHIHLTGRVKSRSATGNLRAAKGAIPGSAMQPPETLLIERWEARDKEKPYLTQLDDNGDDRY